RPAASFLPASYAHSWGGTWRALLTCWLGVGQGGFAPLGAHPLGHSNQCHRIAPNPMVSGLSWHEQCVVRRGRAGSTGPRPATCPEHSGEANARSGLFSGTERKTPYPHLSLCDTNHRSMLKGFPMLGENTLQRAIHAVGMHIAEAKRDHTG